MVNINNLIATILFAVYSKNNCKVISWEDVTNYIKLYNIDHEPMKIDYTFENSEMNNYIANLTLDSIFYYIKPDILPHKINKFIVKELLLDDKFVEKLIYNRRQYLYDEASIEIINKYKSDFDNNENFNNIINFKNFNSTLLKFETLFTFYLFKNKQFSDESIDIKNISNDMFLIIEVLKSKGINIDYNNSILYETIKKYHNYLSVTNTSIKFKDNFDIKSLKIDDDLEELLNKVVNQNIIDSNYLNTILHKRR